MWVAPVTIMVCTLLSYIDRQVLAVLSPMILSDTGLSAAAYANAISAFSIAYTIGNPHFDEPAAGGRDRVVAQLWRMG